MSPHSDLRVSGVLAGFQASQSHLRKGQQGNRLVVQIFNSLLYQLHEGSGHLLQSYLS
jgi:hypothetical protein